MSWFGSPSARNGHRRSRCRNPQAHLGLPALDGRSRELYERALPRGVRLPRFVAGPAADQLLDAAA